MVSVIGAGAWGSAIYHAIKQKTKACITSRRKRDIEGFVSIDEALKNEYIIIVIATLEAAAGVLIFLLSNRITKEIIPDKLDEGGKYND